MRTYKTQLPSEAWSLSVSLDSILLSYAYNVIVLGEVGGCVYLETNAMFIDYTSFIYIFAVFVYISNLPKMISKFPSTVYSLI